MTNSQLCKLAYLLQIAYMGQLRKDKDKGFLYRLSGLSDAIELSKYDAVHLNRCYADNIRMIRKIEREQL